MAACTCRIKNYVLTFNKFIVKKALPINWTKIEPEQGLHQTEVEDV
jgi:hypothetical protein